MQRIVFVMGFVLGCVFQATALAQCTVDSDCTQGNAMKCNGATGVCYQCTGDGDCGGDVPACDTTQGRCVGCVEDDDCDGVCELAQSGDNLVQNGSLNGTLGDDMVGTPFTTGGCDTIEPGTPNSWGTLQTSSNDGGTAVLCVAWFFGDSDSFQQTVSGFNIGTTYFVKFLQSHTGLTGGFLEELPGSWEVQVDGGSIGYSNTMEVPQSPGYNRWECVERAFVATETEHTILFRAALQATPTQENHAANMAIDGIVISTEPGCPQANQCVAECTVDGDCADGEVCTDFTCVPETSTCTDDATGNDMDTGCTVDLPVCDTTGADPVCVAATTAAACTDDATGNNMDTGCTVALPVCDTTGTDPVCVAATTTDACTDDAAGNNTDTGCSGATPVCDTSGSTPTCVAPTSSTGAGLSGGSYGCSVSPSRSLPFGGALLAILGVCATIYRRRKR
ncbi:MAG: hypothetical protein R3A47_04285 [Polyangiales bacterium]